MPVDERPERSRIAIRGGRNQRGVLCLRPRRASRRAWNHSFRRHRQPRHGHQILSLSTLAWDAAVLRALTAALGSDERPSSADLPRKRRFPAKSVGELCRPLRDYLVEKPSHLEERQSHPLFQLGKARGIARVCKQLFEPGRRRGGVEPAFQAQAQDLRQVV